MILDIFLQDFINNKNGFVGLVTASCAKDLKEIRNIVLKRILALHKKNNFGDISATEFRVCCTKENDITSTILFNVINNTDSVRDLGAIEDAILRFNLSSTSIQLLNQVWRNEKCKIFDMEKQ